VVSGLETPVFSLNLNANINRLILYYPVSALVTLFGNILQNPQDPRARSDVRLMNLVVNFLSMLNADEENGGVKRMLGVCAEFERIAKVVLDKAEKEGPRRKRKNAEDLRSKGTAQNAAAATKASTMQNGPTPMASVISSIMANTLNAQHGLTPMDMGGTPGSQWTPDFPNSNNEFMSPGGQGGMTTFSDIQSFADGLDSTPSALDPNAFQQPFVPQDLWQMPMTLEWDWANITGAPYSGFENGVIDDTGLHNNEPL
jgi:hypothetical protein